MALRVFGPDGETARPVVTTPIHVSSRVTDVRRVVGLTLAGLAGHTTPHDSHLVPDQYLIGGLCLVVSGPTCQTNLRAQRVLNGDHRTWSTNRQREEAVGIYGRGPLVYITEPRAQLLCRCPEVGGGTDRIVGRISRHPHCFRVSVTREAHQSATRSAIHPTSMVKRDTYPRSINEPTTEDPTQERNTGTDQRPNKLWWRCPFCGTTSLNRPARNNTGAEGALRSHIHASEGDGHGPRFAYPEDFDPTTVDDYLFAR